MDKNLQELIQYISSIDKPCAADILCSMQQVHTSLNKVLAHFKEKIKAEVDEDSFDDVGQLATYCNLLKEISNSDSTGKRPPLPETSLQTHTDNDVDGLLDEEFL